MGTQLDATDLQMIASNMQLLSRLLPRSAARALEKVVQENPACLLRPLDAWHEFLTSYGVSQQAFCSLVLWRSAHVITASTPFQAGTVILALQHWGCSSSDINRSVLARAPQALLLQEHQMQALRGYLVGACGMQQARFRDLVVAAPAVLLQDVDAQLRPRVAFLQEALGASDEQLAQMLHKAPGLLLSDSGSHVRPRLQLLRECGYAAPQLRHLLVADPSLMALSVGSLRRRHAYLDQELRLGCTEVLEQLPTYYTRNLVGDVAPRHAFVMARGLQHKLAAPTASDGRQQQPGQQQPGQQQPGQQQPGQRQQLGADPPIHLGRLLEPSLPEFLALLGVPGAGEEYAAFAQHWRETEGLRWTAVRAL